MVPGTIRDLKAMLLGMSPRLSDRVWCFHKVSDARFIPDTAFAIIREEEGVCCILPAQAAPADAPQFAQITLRVHSDLEAVGLTAAVASVLANSGIACNVIAGLHHDHLFVPFAQRDEALALLNRLSLDARR
ncbi:ACT domain-containing protein [Qipengyuania sp. ASV99]|uniref:ACT domain-containing protein n=1 Tax=Qipengyuania sp. ASV99 TaxID=3399681 RepID=UPI003A4C82DF